MKATVLSFDFHSWEVQLSLILTLCNASSRTVQVTAVLRDTSLRASGAGKIFCELVHITYM